MKIEIDDEVTKILSGAIRSSVNAWKEIPLGHTTKSDFEMQPFPTQNIDRGGFMHDYSSFQLPIFNREYLMREVCNILGAEKNTNYVAYGPMTCMYWHTNSDTVGQRVYYTFTMGEAIFRYRDKNGNMVDDSDNVGWTARAFDIRSDEPLWHTIWTEQIRFSFGFNRNVS